jgi:hypothetical protein
MNRRSLLSFLGVTPLAVLAPSQEAHFDVARMVPGEKIDVVITSRVITVDPQKRVRRFGIAGQDRMHGYIEVED